MSPTESTNEEAANGITAFGIGPPLALAWGDGLELGLTVGTLGHAGLAVGEALGFGEAAIPEGVADAIAEADGTLEGEVGARLACEEAAGEGDPRGAARTPSTFAGRGATSAVREQAVRRMAAQIAPRDTLFMIKRIARQSTKLKHSDRTVSKLTTSLLGAGAGL